MEHRRGAHGSWLSTSALERPLHAGLAFLLACVATLGPRAAAQPATPGVRRIVTKVEFEGNREIKESAIRTKIKTREGSEYDEEILNQDIKSLYNVGFYNVRYFTEAYEGGVKVRFVLFENPLIAAVTFRGIEELDQKDIEDVIDVRKGQFLSENTLNIQTREILTLYRSKGYHFVEVEYRLVPKKKGNEVIFDIVEGPRVTVNDITFRGNKALTASQLKDVMVLRESSLFTTGLYEERTFYQDGVAVKERYRADGYRDSTVEIDRIDFTADKSRASLGLRIVEGNLYSVRSVKVSGNTAFTEVVLLAKTKLKPGKPYLRTERDHDLDSILAVYQNNAYVRASVIVKETFSETGYLVDLDFAVTEDRKFNVGRINVTGNRLTKDHVIRRELSFNPGEPVNVSEIRKSFYRLISLGYFDVEGGLKFEPDYEVNAGIQDWTILVKEGRTGNLRFAAGVGSDSGLIGQMSISKKNFDIADVPGSFSDLIEGNAFTGAGQTIFLDVAPGTEVSQIGVGFREPYVFGSDNSFGIDVTRRFRNFDVYDQIRTGVDLTLGRYLEKFSRDISVELHFRNQLVDIKHLTDEFQDICDRRGDEVPDCASVGLNRVVAIGPSLNWRSVNNPLLPSDGYEFGVSYEVGGGILGGNTDMNRAIVDATRYFTLYGGAEESPHILATRLKIGWESGYGETPTVPIYERLFAGGRASIRGFEFRGAGPHKKGQPVGGQGLVTGGFEYSVPIYEEIFRGVVFLDYGTVSETFGQLAFNERRVAAGFGIRFRVPFLGPVPFAFDFGFPIRSEEDDDLQVVSFSLGQVFF